MSTLLLVQVMDTGLGTHIGTMRSACVGQVWADSHRERALAHTIFGTPLDTRTWFTEPHGFWWGVLEVFWPRANFIHVWLHDDVWH
jgi:hypothetical protein